MTKMVITAELPIELTNGNDGRGNKWFSSAKLRKDIEAVLRTNGFTREPLDMCAIVHVTRVLGKGQRLWDADSILRGNAKELLDALVAVGWFVDDGPKWIRSVYGFQDDTRRQDGPSTRIRVFPFKENQ